MLEEWRQYKLQYQRRILHQPASPQDEHGGNWQPDDTDWAPQPEEGDLQPYEHDWDLQPDGQDWASQPEDDWQQDEHDRLQDESDQTSPSHEAGSSLDQFESPLPRTEDGRSENQTGTPRASRAANGEKKKVVGMTAAKLRAINASRDPRRQLVREGLNIFPVPPEDESPHVCAACNLPIVEGRMYAFYMLRKEKSFHLNFKCIKALPERDQDILMDNLLLWY
jgi:hypothetical protein